MACPGCAPGQQFERRAGPSPRRHERATPHVRVARTGILRELAAGTHTLASRATAQDGLSQPEEFPPNERGYGNNGWRVHAVDVTVS